MAKKSQDTIEVAKITMIGAIVVAVISLVGNLVLGYWQFILKPSEVDQAETTQKSTSLAIEKISLDIFAYGGNGNPDGGYGTFVLVNDREKVPNYRLDYSLPEDGRGYAGLAFNFQEGVNVSAFNAIECVIMFKKPDDQIDLYIKDVATNFNTIRVVNNGANEMVLRYEFKNFPKINFNAVKEIGLVASTEFSTATRQVTIKNVRFTK
jgi:hypothetical protein